MPASGSSIVPPPVSGTATRARSPGNRSTSTHAVRFSSRSTQGRVSSLIRSSGWRTSRALRPARSTARTASSGLSWPSASGRPAVSAWAEVGRSSNRVRMTRQPSRASSVAKPPPGARHVAGLDRASRRHRALRDRSHWSAAAPSASFRFATRTAQLPIRKPMAGTNRRPVRAVAGIAPWISCSGLLGSEHRVIFSCR